MLSRVLLAVLTLFALGTGVAKERARIVHQEKSLYRNIYIVESAEHRCMIFGRLDARQGCLYPARPQVLALPYAKAFFAGFLAAPAPRRVLVIGLGIGSMPMAIQAYDPAIRVDVVELDPAVVRVARERFGYRCGPRCRTFVDDGRVFVRKQRRAAAQYDLILVDAFDVKYIPEHLLTREFMSELRDVLAPGGIVAANTFSRGALQPYEIATYQSVFGQTLAVDAGIGNRILLAGRDGPPSLAAMQRNAARIQPRVLPFGVSTSQILARTRVQALERRRKPLTDQYSPANLLLGY